MSPLPDGEDGAWIAQARRLPEFACDAVFSISASFYVGPDNGMTRLEWHEANVLLPPLDLPRRFVDRVDTMELLGREDALIRHYRQLLAVAEAYGKVTTLRPFPHFRIQPAIVADGEMLTEFPWNDDLNETRTVLQLLAGSNRGPPRLLHVDVDQGWQILVVATGGMTRFIEWDVDGPPPATGGYAVDAAELARQADAALNRLRVIHDRLVQALGHDHWTYHPTPHPIQPTSRFRSVIRRLFRIDARSRAG